ncbi:MULTISPECIES: circularly permuted type 2 ATP-grasp protein [Luteimonas]|uniref:circularly permuted type 2 ATP-grasp protein n=1 Tax=Luteimonas TaxID=83614 RepID=UPI0018EB87E6|nr:MULTISPECIES: circularly permuted type 2 ATP-grasp protein [Luteimonas]
MPPSYDEMHDADGNVRPHYRAFDDWRQRTPADEIAHKRRQAEISFHRVGITFSVYGEESGNERLIPFDLVPRIVPAAEWKMLEAGLRQRVHALNLFLGDIYGEQRILRDRRIPAELVLDNSEYRKEMQGLKLAGNVYSHVSGIDLVRAGDGEYYVLEDNLRVASGVSYMLENRRMMSRLLPEVFARQQIAPVERYPDALFDILRECAPANVDNPVVAVLTPGAANSAYFEHAFLAQQMGVELVEGADLFVQNDMVYAQTTRGAQRVHVIYRRINDDFLDPTVFRPESRLGVPGLFGAYRAGNVTLANAPGTGVGDDKSVYPYVPDMIRYYLSEEPILHNVPTWQLRNPDDLKYALEHLPELVVKEVHGAGGYGMLVGPASTKAEIEEFRARILADPSNYIAQPTLSLSTCPTYVESGLAPRHIDLRPYILSGRRIHVIPGGLTRVALREGSLVVNSSQGGGTKDTWIMEN